MTTEKFDLVLRFDDEVSRALFFEWFWHLGGEGAFSEWVGLEESLIIVPGGLNGAPDAQVQTIPFTTHEADFDY